MENVSPVRYAMLLDDPGHMTKFFVFGFLATI
jgi:hypothetical protein